MKINSVMGPRAARNFRVQKNQSACERLALQSAQVIADDCQKTTYVFRIKELQSDQWLHVVRFTSLPVPKVASSELIGTVEPRSHAVYVHCQPNADPFDVEF